MLGGAVSAYAADTSINTPKVSKAAKAETMDVFSGLNWHAVKGSWPGVITFDAKTKEVSLQPIGGDPMTASYEVSLDPAKKGSNKITGTLTMREKTRGMVSRATFTLEKKRHLTLAYETAPVTEYYEGLTLAEEKAAMDRLRKQMGVKKFELPK